MSTRRTPHLPDLSPLDPADTRGDRAASPAAQQMLATIVATPRTALVGASAETSSATSVVASTAGQPARTARERAGGRTPALLSRRTWIGLGAGVAASALLAGIVVNHDSAPAPGRTSAAAQPGGMQLVAFSIPASTTAPALDCHDSSSGAYQSVPLAQAPELLYLPTQAQTPPGMHLSLAGIQATECGRAAWPAASFLTPTPDGHGLQQALTVWGPNAGGLPAAMAANAVQETTIADHPARVRVNEWGTVLSWSVGKQHWVITAAGLDATTATVVAERIVADGGTRGVGAVVPQMQAVDLPARPERSVQNITQYDSDTAEADPENPSLPSFNFTVDPATTPWQAYVSTGPLVDTKLTKVAGQTASVSFNGPTVASLRWDITPDMTVSLIGDTTTGGLESLLEVAASLQPAAANDPRYLALGVVHDPIG